VNRSNGNSDFAFTGVSYRTTQIGGYMDEQAASEITQMIAGAVGDLYRIQRQLNAFEAALEVVNPELFQKYRERLDSLTQRGDGELRFGAALEHLQAFLEKH
jgi:hypothetical protein